LITVQFAVTQGAALDLRLLLVEGRGTVPELGSVIGTGSRHPPFVVHDSDAVEIEPVTGLKCP
jgi:hypothetical protein